MNKDSELIILGCGGHSKVVTDVAEEIGFKNISYLDKFNKNREFLGRTIISYELENYTGYFFVAIGDNHKRELIFNEFQNKNKRSNPISLIHPSSTISKRCSIGKGTIVMPNCVINSCSDIAEGVIINTKASVDHDNYLMSFSSLAPGVCTGGNVSIGKRSAISIGATIKHGIKIGYDVVVGANSLVMNDIENNQVAYGTPAKFIRKRSKGDKYL